MNTTSGKFICHRDFADQAPIDVFHKERQEKPMPPAEERYQNRHILFRKSFSLPDFTNARIRITADDYFKLYINGKFVMQGPPPSYPSAYYYMQQDVTAFLHPGDNVIAVHTYYQGLINRVWVSGDRRQSFFCEADLDGKLFLASDESWKCADHAAYSACGTFGYDTAFAECYDSAAKEVGFEQPEYDDAGWENACVYKNADYRLLPSPIQPLAVYPVEPVRTEMRGNTLFLDFGREYVGQLYAEAVGAPGDELLLHYGEELKEDGSVRYEMRCNCRYEEKWRLSGKKDTLNQFDYKAFRYAEIVFPQGVALSRPQMIVRHYPFVKKAVYSSEDPGLDRVLKLCEDTVHYGIQEVLVDCPTREKGQYLGDACVSGRAQCILTQDTTMIKKAIRDFCHSAFICKGLMAVSTSSLMQEIADYSLLFSSLVLWTYRFDRDDRFLRETFPFVRGVYEYFSACENEDGLLENVTEKWNLVDWPMGLRDGYDFPLTIPVKSGVHNVLNAFWIGFLKAYDELCDIMGTERSGKTGRVEKAFIRTFYNAQTGLFCDSAAQTHSAVHSNVLPLLFDIGTEDRELTQRLVNFIAGKKLTSMGVYMAYFALAALVKKGERQKAIALATDENAWLNMIAEGGTATFEAWSKTQKKNTSLFHPWAVAPLIVFSREDNIF